MAADAIAFLSRIGVKTLCRLDPMAGKALLVVERGVVAAGILMGNMAGGTRQIAGFEAAALGQSQRLEADVF